MNKYLAYIVLGLAVIAAAIAVAIKSVNDGKAADKYDNAKLQEAQIASAEAKKASDEAKAAEARAAAAASALEKTKAEKALAQEKRRENESRLAAEQEEQANLELKAKVAADEAKAAAAKAQKAAEERKAKEAEAKKAEAELAAQESKTRAAEAETERERIRAQKVADEAILLRTSIAELEQMKSACEMESRELERYRRELDEREEALRPPKTVKDLVSLGEEENTSTNSPNQIMAQKLAESRTDGEKTLERLNESRRDTVMHIEAQDRRRRVAGLMDEMKKALDEDRIIDARYYFNAIKGLYPDWSLK